MNKFLLALGVNGALAIKIADDDTTTTTFDLIPCAVHDGSGNFLEANETACTENNALTSCHPDHHVCLLKCTADVDCTDDSYNTCDTNNGLCMIGPAKSCLDACNNGECDLCQQDRLCGVTCTDESEFLATLTSCVTRCDVGTHTECHCLYNGVWDTTEDVVASGVDATLHGFDGVWADIAETATNAVNSHTSDRFVAIKTQATEAVDSAKQQVNLALDSAKTKANTLLETATQKLVVAKEHLVSPVKEAEVVAN